MLEMKTEREGEQWQPAIDFAPGKEEIEQLRSDPRADTLARFFEARARWCSGYPLVHDHFVTYGAFTDLIRALDAEQRMALLPAVMELAQSVSDRYFHVALSLLSDLIPNDAIRQRPVGLSDLVLRLRLRAEKLAFLPNLQCTWDGFVLRQRYLKSPDDFLAPYSQRQLGINGNHWDTFFKYPLINYGCRMLDGFPGRFDRLRSRIQALGASPGARRLIYATRIEASRYWVWRIPGKRGTAHLWTIVFVRAAADEPAEMGQWDLFKQSHERDTPEAISKRLLKIEFSVATLEKLGS